ncbi:hypothetical protein AB4238_05335 [Shewanella sp. 10N.286.45.A1]|uniref:hypothetical protein n=1 Tax=Shewanella sp. 10N.286.45.A1 TaxID=3229694 RepID=UPI00355134F8
MMRLEKHLKPWLPLVLLLSISMTSLAYEAPFAVKEPIIDAVADEAVWQQAV